MYTFAILILLAAVVWKVTDLARLVDAMLDAEEAVVHSMSECRAA